jgi:hypothetical protein
MFLFFLENILQLSRKRQQITIKTKGIRRFISFFVREIKSKDLYTEQTYEAILQKDRKCRIFVKEKFQAVR